MLWWAAVIVCVLLVVTFVWYHGRTRSMPEFIKAYESSIAESKTKEVALYESISSLRSRAPFDKLTGEDIKHLVSAFSALPEPKVLSELFYEAARVNSISVLKDRNLLKLFADRKSGAVRESKGLVERTLANRRSTKPRMSEKYAARTWVDVMIFQVRKGYPGMISSLTQYADEGKRIVPDGTNIIIGVSFFLGLIAIRNTQSAGPAPRIMHYSQQALLEMMGELGPDLVALSDKLWELYYEAEGKRLDPLAAIAEATLGLLNLADIDGSKPISSQVSNRLLVTATERWLVGYSGFWKQVTDRVDITY
jgi:hypothetical protein